MSRRRVSGVYALALAALALVAAPIASDAQGVQVAFKLLSPFNSSYRVAAVVPVVSRNVLVPSDAPSSIVYGLSSLMWMRNVTRDANLSVAAEPLGSEQSLSIAQLVDGGVAEGPQGSLLFALGGNPPSIAQYAPQRRGQVALRTTLSNIASNESVTSIVFVGSPPFNQSLAASGALRFTTRSGLHFGANFSLDSVGLVVPSALGAPASLGIGAVEALVLHPGGAPLFPGPGALVGQSGQLRAYELDSQGVLNASSVRVVGEYARDSFQRGANFDPVSGDLLLASDRSLIVIAGFPRPAPATCAIFFAQGSNCSDAAADRTAVSPGVPCSGVDDCANRCCQSQPANCSAFRALGWRCSAGREVRPDSDALNCSSVGTCAELCCPVTPANCSGFFAVSSCGAGREPSGAAPSVACRSIDECSATCCRQVPANCSAFRALGGACDAASEPLPLSHATPCANLADCRALCCRARPANCSQHFERGCLFGLAAPVPDRAALPCNASTTCDRLCCAALAPPFSGAFQAAYRMRVVPVGLQTACVAVGASPAAPRSLDCVQRPGGGAARLTRLSVTRDGSGGATGALASVTVNESAPLPLPLGAVADVRAGSTAHSPSGRVLLVAEADSNSIAQLALSNFSSQPPLIARTQLSALGVTCCVASLAFAPAGALDGSPLLLLATSDAQLWSLAFTEAASGGALTLFNATVRGALSASPNASLLLAAAARAGSAGFGAQGGVVATGESEALLTAIDWAASGLLDAATLRAMLPIDALGAARFAAAVADDATGELWLFPRDASAIVVVSGLLGNSSGGGGGGETGAGEGGGGLSNTEVIFIVLGIFAGLALLTALCTVVWRRIEVKRALERSRSELDLERDASM